MSDTAHNTIITIILILAIIIVGALFFRGYQNARYSMNYQYYPASALMVQDTPVYSQSVVSYSRPSHLVQTYGNTSKTSYTTYGYDTTYSYSNPAPQVTYYGTGYTVPNYNYSNRYYYYRY